MKNIDRRQLCAVLSGIALTAATKTECVAQAGPPAVPATAHPEAGTLGRARAITLDQMQERKTATGESWAVARGTLPTGETVNLHATMQNVGAPPAQLHAIQHSEFILVREGDLEFQHEVDGKIVSERASAGAVLYIPYGTRHAVCNVGSVPARYLVVGIGGDAK